MLLSESVFCLIIMMCLFFLDFASCQEALSADKEGVCTVNIRSPRTRTKFYTVASNKWCGNKRCIARKSKVEKYVVTTTQLACCNGWEYSEDKCVPLCSTGCSGGRCVGPDVCQCDPPAYLDPAKNNTCITPKCDPACVNAICRHNNTCECLDGFVQFNSTLCQPQCAEGFRNDGEDLSCKPFCEDCSKGNCTGPNTCVCLEGYEKGANGSCVPACESCNNGVCADVNKCVCNEGYVFDNATGSCVPYCEGCIGNCTAPGVCQCQLGFRESNGTCQPVCDPCVNGSCTAPGVCSCGHGLVLRDGVCVGCGGLCNGTCVEDECTEGTTCKRISFKTMKVRNGTTQVKTTYRCGPRGSKICPRTKSVPKFSDVVKQTLECCVGWEYRENDTCQPVCRHECSNGLCVAPDQCQCTPPMILQNNTQCVMPTCDPACVNAWCSAPNTCTCNPDFAAYNSTHCAPKCQDDFYNDPNNLECRPKCDRPCINGTCTGLNTCTCIEGYKLENGDRFKCVPTCQPLCENSSCTALNTCSCYEGFKKESAWQCIPVCDECDHGDCTAPGVCKCHNGYLKAGSKCTPVCQNDCLNGFCSEPDVCTCESGYRSQNSSCVPVCETSCVNSTCTSPNVCSCLEGYEATSIPSVCMPKCDNCQNGRCVEPGKCLCNSGYSLKEGKCTPECDRECTNGFCSEPNICTCHLGYIANGTDKFSCLPVCDPECENASCESPTTCSCFAGYETSENTWSCRPKCQDPCRNGFCVAPNVCSCKEGYLRNVTNSSACYKPCQGACEMGVCTEHGNCVCNSGFVLVNETCIAITPVDCSSCDAKCSENVCQCANGTSCSDAAQPLSMAGLEMTWLIGSAVCLLLLALLFIVIGRTWRRRKLASAKTAQPAENGALYSSVLYTRPDGLLPRTMHAGPGELAPASADAETADGTQTPLEEARVLLSSVTVVDS